MIFRGNIGPWYNPEIKEFHLKKPDAGDPLSRFLEIFKEKSQQNEYPEEVFVHAKTYFNDDEWEGFQESAHGKSKTIGVRIRNDSQVKFDERRCNMTEAPTIMWPGLSGKEYKT